METWAVVEWLKRSPRYRREWVEFAYEAAAAARKSEPVRKDREVRDFVGTHLNREVTEQASAKPELMGVYRILLMGALGRVCWSEVADYLLLTDHSELY